MPAALGLPAGGVRSASTVAGAPESLVQPGRLLSAAGLRRPTGPLPRRAALEDDLLAGAVWDGRRPGGRCAAMDHVAACLRRTANELSTGAVRSRPPAAAAG